MLILAGVSLNAIIGDNGIINSAQETKILQGMTALEEWLQEKYIEYCSESEDNSNKIEMLASKIDNLLLTNSSTRKYVIYEGKAYYLLNKAILPNEIKEGLIGGESNNVAEYTRLIDVYGITKDLKVYYVDMKSNKTYGKLDDNVINPNTPLAVANGNEDAYSLIVSELSKTGVDVDSELGITFGNISSLKSLNIDGTVNNISSLKSISELMSLQTLTLKNLRLNDLLGIENLSKLENVYFDNCDINDYSNLSTAYNLKSLSFYFPAENEATTDTVTNMTEKTANLQITRLGDGLKNANKITGLEKIYIYGEKDAFLTSINCHGTDGVSIGYTYKVGYYVFNSNIRSNLSDISGLSNLSNSIKSSVKKIRLNNYKITSISCFANFNSLEEILMPCNSQLTSLTGLENKVKLRTVVAQLGAYSNLSGLSGCRTLKNLFCWGNNNLNSFSGIESLSELYILCANDCSISDISALEGIDINNDSILDGLDKLEFLDLSNNLQLISISSITKCDGLVKLSLSGCTNISMSEFTELASKIISLGDQCSYPSKYSVCLSSISGSLELSKDTEDLVNVFESLNGNTSLKRLKLNACTKIGNSIMISDSKVNEVLESMTNLEYVSLYNCSNISTISFVTSLNLKELDLYGTSVVNLTPLNSTVSENLINLRVSKKPSTSEESTYGLGNYKILLKNIFNNGTLNDINDSWISKSYIHARGLMVCYTGYEIEIPETVTATTLVWRGLKSGDWDVSKCSSATKIYFGGDLCNVKCPANVTFVGQMFNSNSVTFDFGNCSRLTSYQVDQGIEVGYIVEKTGFEYPDYIADSLSSLPDNNILNEIQISRTKIKSLNFLNAKTTSNTSKFSLLTKINIYAGNIYGMEMPGLTSMTGIENAINLKELRISHSFITSVPDLSGLTQLTKVNLSNNKISNIEGLNNCTSITSLDLSNTASDNENRVNMVGNINVLSTLTNLNTLDLTGNIVGNISSLSYCKNLVNLTLSNCGFSNLSPLRSLIDSSNKTLLRKLNLTGCTSLEDTDTATGYNNHQVLVDLKKGGCTNINISGTSLSSV